MKLRRLSAVIAALLLIACFSMTSFAAIPGYSSDPPSTTFIPGAPVPLAVMPGLTTIVDGAVPLGQLPKSGADMAVGCMAVLGVVTIGLGVAFGLKSKKAKQAE